jgi:hypothetical protein
MLILSVVEPWFRLDHLSCLFIRVYFIKIKFLIIRLFHLYLEFNETSQFQYY